LKRARASIVRRLVFGALLLTSCFGAARGAVAAIPSDQLLASLKPSGHVNDFAALLTSVEREALESRLRKLQQDTGAEVAVVTLKSLEGGQIEDFTNKLFSRWRIGKKGQDNGLLLLAAIEDRKAWLEVGYGLEPILPDSLAGRILDQNLFPAFRGGRYADGLNTSIERIAQIIERGEQASVVPRNGGPPLELAGMEWFAMLLLTSIFVAIGCFMAGVGLGIKTTPVVVFGMVFGLVPLFVGLGLGGYWSSIVHLPLALLSSVFGYSVGRNMPPVSRGRRKSRRYNTGWDWLGGGTGSGGWGGGWGGGGGFSSGGGFGGFGGGSSGGGGAGGSW
jgi:uncharacterized protein